MAHQRVQRREAIVEIAKTYKWGDEIPRIEYSEAEIDTWRTVYNELVALYPTHACAQFNHVLPLLIQECGYGPDNIPQLEDISRYGPVNEYLLLWVVRARDSRAR